MLELAKVASIWSVIVAPRQAAVGARSSGHVARGFVIWQVLELKAIARGDVEADGRRRAVGRVQDPAIREHPYREKKPEHHASREPSLLPERASARITRKLTPNLSLKLLI